MVGSGSSPSSKSWSVKILFIAWVRRAWPRRHAQLLSACGVGAPPTRDVRAAEPLSLSLPLPAPAPTQAIFSVIMLSSYTANLTGGWGPAQTARHRRPAAHPGHSGRLG